MSLQADQGQENENPETTKTLFLERLVGQWEGSGKSNNREIRDLMQFQWALNQRFVHFFYRALAGDNYEGEGYIWYNPSHRCYEWWEFNNGQRPVRMHTGHGNQNQLILEEDGEEQKMRLTFTFVDDSTLEMTESFLEEEQVEPYVRVRFQRKT
jgi:hypothetical protein